MRAFTGATGHPASTPVRGNPCVVHVAAAPPQRPPAPAPHIQCITWPDGPGQAQVRCWAPTGQEIQLCGHGLLCCGHYWRAARGDTDLRMGEVAVQFAHRDGLDWVGFPMLATEGTAVPGWAKGLLGAAPNDAASAGGDRGYLVLAMPDDCDIAALPAPGDALAAHTAHSLIVTRSVEPSRALCGESIQYRYFAPQFGVPEDSATGSAMRVLAAYWQQRGHGDEQRALQRSPAGGWLLSRVEGERTWIGGHVQDDTGAAA